MASLIPKIKVGKAVGKKEKHNLSFDCSTTLNIGNIQPTMCREMAPQSKFKVKVSSLVRLASMPLPTFGRISLRNYHCFVPYIDLYQPFDALMSGQHYLGVNSASFVPTKIPFFTMEAFKKWFINYSDISICEGDDVSKPYTITMTNVDWAGVTYNVGTGEGDYPDYPAAVRAAQAADLARIQTAWSAIRTGGGAATIFGGQTSPGIYSDGAGSAKQDDYGSLNLGDFSAYVGKNDATLVISYQGVTGGNVEPSIGQTSITFEGADIVTRCGNYTLLMKFKAPLKRLRTIMIGLGYQFSPYNTEEFSVLKLLAYYKAWFALFRPNRELAFVDTTCYQLIKKMSEKNGVNVLSGLGDTSIFNGFIESLIKDCYYYLPQDYFSMSVLKPQNGNQDADFTLSSGATFRADQFLSDGSSGDKVTALHQLSMGDSAITDPAVKFNAVGSTNPLTIKLALKMLTWANKNTVIGRSVREYLKVHFGITDTQTIDDDAVYRIGSSRTNIQISDVMSTAENSEGYLGEYAGKGIGYGDSETFDFTADKFGVWLTLTVIVPESGYYQGYMKENRHLNRYQFFNPEYDALGYQVLERGEVMDDYCCDGSAWNPRTAFERTRAFGLVPRYSEYKVGRNIVNGDLSLAGMFPSMGGYFLDRRFPAGLAKSTNIRSDGFISRAVVPPSFVPSVVYDNFRRIDPSDHVGQYNRMFNVVTNDVDHFIVHAIFDVTGYLPMKSLSESFDTVASDDDGSIDITHS